MFWCTHIPAQMTPEGRAAVLHGRLQKQTLPWWRGFKAKRTNKSWRSGVITGCREENSAEVAIVIEWHAYTPGER